MIVVMTDFWRYQNDMDGVVINAHGGFSEGGVGDNGDGRNVCGRRAMGVGMEGTFVLIGL